METFSPPGLPRWLFETQGDLATVGSDGELRTISAAGIPNGYVLTRDDTANGGFKWAEQATPGSSLFITPESYGAVGNGTTDDTAHFQSAIDALTAAGGGTLWLFAKRYAVGGLILKSNVTIRSGTRSTLVPPSGFTGWMLDTPASPKQFNIALIDINISGAVSSISSPNTGGVKFRLTATSKLVRVGISATSLGCFQQLAGQATQVLGCGFQNFFTYRTLTSVEGAVYLGGTDHTVFGCECNGGDLSALAYPTTLYRCGLVIAGSTMWIVATNGEYSEVGIRVTGSNNRFIAARGDVNSGHGIMVDGTLNNFTNTLVGSNSIGSPGNYDGVYLSAGAYGTVLDGVQEFLDFTGSTQHRHVVNDQVDIFTDARSAPILPHIRDVVDARSYKYRRINQLYVSRAIEEPATGSPVARQPSRYSAGATFFDGVSNKLTISDGAKWRDIGGDIVGNLLDPRTANMNDPAEIGWTVLSGSGSTTSALGGNGWPKFARARLLEIIAGGAATSCGAQMKVAYRPTNVKTGSSYTVMLYHLGVTQLASVAVVVLWYDSGGTLIGSPTVLASDTQAVVNTAQLYRKTAVVAPAGAAQANLQVVFTRTGMASGEKYQATKVCLVPGAPTDYVEP